MSSPSNAIRSLSADELSSSLSRTNRVPPATPEPVPTTLLPVNEPKPKSGLLKRLRRAFRINAQSMRVSRQDKPSTRPVHVAIPPNPSRSAVPNGQPPNTATPQPPPVPSPNPEPRHQKFSHPPRSVGPAKLPAPYSRSWRGPLSSKTLLSERHAAELGETGRGSRRFMGLSTEASKKHSSNIAVNPSNIPVSQTNASNHNPPSQPRHALRSLPKRVVSSPPSLTGPSFGFGVRKRNSVAGKTVPARSGTISGTIGEGDSDSVKKLDRVFNARGRVYDGRGSMNLAPVSPSPNGYAPTPEHSADAFRSVVEGAAAGRLSFSQLLDAMFRLEERLLPDVKELLIKFLSRPENMEALIDRLTTVVDTVADDEGVEGPGGERERYRYSYVSCMLLSNGPIQLRRSLFANAMHLDRLVGVLGHGHPTEPFVVRSVCKVLLSVLRDSSDDTVRAMGRRKDFIDALLSHIAVTGCPEVCLSMLSTVRCQAELKFGPSNKPVVGMMADSKLVETLCDKLSHAAESGPLNGTASSTIENCSRVIVGIALRALVIPRDEICDDDSDAMYRMKFNRDLSSLDVFREPRPILRLLDSGLAALSAHDTRGYALSTALTAVRYLLVTALNGQDSSLSTIRMQLMTVKTAAYEAGVRARIPKMAHVLEHARDGVVVETMWEKVENPLGVVRLKILELVVVLLQHCSEATAKAIVSAEIPSILMKLFVRLTLNSLLQHFVAAIVELSFSGKFSCLRRSFLMDVRLVDRVMELWDSSVETPSSRMNGPVNYTGELMRMICVIHDFFKHDSPEAKEIMQEIGVAKIETFKRFCEGAVAIKLKENGPLLCGPGELPSRPMDTLPIDGYTGIAVRPRQETAS